MALHLSADGADHSSPEQGSLSLPKVKCDAPRKGPYAIDQMPMIARMHNRLLPVHVRLLGHNKGCCEGADRLRLSASMNPSHSASTDWLLSYLSRV